MFRGTLASYPINPAATVAPNFQHASRAFLAGAPETMTCSAALVQPSPGSGSVPLILIPEVQAFTPARTRGGPPQGRSRCPRPGHATSHRRRSAMRRFVCRTSGVPPPHCPRRAFARLPSRGFQDCFHERLRTIGVMNWPRRDAECRRDHRLGTLVSEFV
ncbi:Uncharacterised protein [Clostridioides difficile]|nr:Uncharacterised protein [Clostridioides difficile]